MKNDRVLNCLAVTFLGLLWLGFGLFLAIYAPADSPIRGVGAVAAVIGLLAAVLGFVFGTRERPPAAAPADAAGTTQPLAPTRLSPPKFFGVIFLAALSVSLMYGLLIWWQSGSQKADTVGYAELTTSVGSFTFDLPPQWRISYYGRNRQRYYQGRVVDEAGRPRFRIYGGLVAAADLEGLARKELDGYRKAGYPVEWSEFRDSPQGRWWAYAVNADHEDRFLVKRPLTLVRYYRQRDGIHLEFTMPADEAAELEPLAWKLAQTAKVKKGP